VALSTLPLEHVFERMVMLQLHGERDSVYFVDDPKRVGEYLARVKPTVMTVVPAFWKR